MSKNITQKLVLLSMAILSSSILQAQDFYQKYNAPSSERTSCFDRATALVITAETDLGDEININVDGDIFSLPRDVDAPDFRYFLSTIPRQICNATFPANACLYVINSGISPKIDQMERMASENCDYTPQPILQSEWRAGLPAPNYSRSFTTVEHVIVHHSAGSNTSTDYTQVVRDIYIYHTQSNGWSDIGYNYVIAQNGALYAARDPGTGAQDNVLGAHFCGKNSNTMGICLLGNYEEANPSNALWETLENLITYKIKKESLNPLTSSAHALGDIGHIAGHRDGCSTLCPGQSVYDRLSTMRNLVADNLDACSANLDLEISELTIAAGDTILFQNLSRGYDSYDWTFDGGNEVAFLENGDVKVVYHNPGTYGVTLTGNANGTSESLNYAQIILVKGSPKIYPNPVISNGLISIASEKTIDQIALYDLNGKYVPLKALSNGTYRLPETQHGLYLLTFRTDHKQYQKKVLILN